MRKKSGRADLVFQFVSFALVCLVLSVLPWPFLLKVAAAFALSLLLSAVYTRARRNAQRRKMEPKRMRVISVKSVED
ncbi:hypothetical protein [Arthrobacter sp. H14-L1]|uniref:hypothetical protein n=1 Tax=Arthrobacter sp. H14-L1 TaxID=2996697 RepID=UPI0022700BA4|nr:hypothetical protein [Arthrobacter sp. H14-L1]MCY0905549.1 hypothetical protein [Arthrobacter sp. H14-L1]